MTCTSLDPATESAHRHSWSIRIAATLLTCFVFVVLLEHVLNPQLPLARHRISEYVNASSGWLMTAGFAAWTISLAATAVTTWSAGLAPGRLRLALATLLVLAFAGALVTTTFPTGTSAGMVPPGQRLTLGNRLHDIGSGVLELALFLALVASAGLHDRPLRSGSCCLFAGGALCVIVFSGPALDAPGLTQRALVTIACAWQYLLLVRLAPARRTAERPGG